MKCISARLALVVLSLFVCLVSQAKSKETGKDNDLIFSNGIYKVTAKKPNQVVKKTFVVREVSSLYLTNLSGETRIIIASERRNTKAEKCQSPDSKKIGDFEILRVKETKVDQISVCEYTGKNAKGFVQVRQYAAKNAKEVFFLTGTSPLESSIKEMFENLKVSYVAKK